MSRLSETSLFWRRARQFKTIVLGVCLCVAALPAAAIDSSGVKIASPLVAMPSRPAFRAVVVLYSAAPVMAQKAVVSAEPAVTLNELIDNHTGNFNGDYVVDARSTRTLDWACIRNAESHDNYHQVSGAYGILTSTWNWFGKSGVPGAASVRTQDAFALRLFAANGHRFSGSWNDACTSGGGLS
jgi:hypothetical protein